MVSNSAWHRVEIIHICKRVWFSELPAHGHLPASSMPTPFHTRLGEAMSRRAMRPPAGNQLGEW